MAKSDGDGAMGCASRICYCCPPRGSDASSAIKVEAVHPSNWQGDGQMLPNGNVSGNGNGNGNVNVNGNANGIENGEALMMKESGNCMPLKSNLKRPPGTSEDPIAGETDNNTCPKESLNGDTHQAEAEQGEPNVSSKRKVQWTDAHGQELTQVQEFERSDSSPSTDEGRGDSDESCTCVIQ